MSSALAAFAKNNATTTKSVADDRSPSIEDDTYAHSDDENDASPSAAIITSKPISLLDVANQQSTKMVTLVDIANEQPTKSLLQVAQTQAAQEQMETQQRLHAIASKVNEEVHTAKKQRDTVIKKGLATTSSAVKQEQQTKRQSQVTLALVEAAHEEQVYEADQFEQEEQAIQKAASRLVESASSISTTERKTRTQSLLDSQRRHGLRSKPIQPPKTMKESKALSSFQCHQLTTTQQRLFMAMLVEEKSTKSRRKGCNHHAMNQLAAHRKKNGEKKERFGKFDDQRHCRFHPRLYSHRNHSSSSSGKGEDDDEDDAQVRADQSTGEFIRRMEATQRVHIESLRRTRAEQEYNAKVDKKECPSCGMQQTYAEMAQKRHKCQNCGVNYRSRLVWGEVADAFLERMAMHLQERLNQTRQQATSPRKIQPTIPSWHQVRDAFLSRVQLDLEQRNLIKEQLMTQVEQEWTFKPVISKHAQALKLGDFEERLYRDLEQRRARQEQYEVVSKAIRQVEGRATHSKGKKLFKQTRVQSFDERLRLDLEKRRQRMEESQNQSLYKAISAGTVTIGQRGRYY